MKNIIKTIQNSIIENKIKWLLVVVFALITLAISWSSDDAYHAYIMAKNLVDGNGFVYNVGYRVTASTCPLFTIITAGVYALLGCKWMYFAGIILGVICSTLAIYLLVFKICKKDIISFLSICILLGCYCFMSYTTAGLENSLLFFLSAVFIVVFTSKEEFSTKELLLLALILSLLAMTRMDSVLLFVTAICAGYLFYSKVRFVKKILIGIVGLLPFIVWEAFSVIYYGYPFPNTMYVKLNTGFPKSDYIVRGVDYIYRSSLLDILLVVIPIIYFILSINWKNKKMMTISIGCILYIAYVINVGGDFMVGRHLTTPFFVSLMGLIVLFNSRDDDHQSAISLKKTLIVFIALQSIWATCSRPIAKEYLYEVKWDPSKTGVADERDYYYQYTGFIPYVSSLIRGESSIIDYLETEDSYDIFVEKRDSGLAGSCEYDLMLSGMINYYVQKDGTICLSDRFGLMDPLLSHLPAWKYEHWRIGHMWREIPEGYSKSVETGTNQIVNESLHEYYDKVLLIIKGDIWDKERLETIINMNLGRYDYLIDDYLSSL